MATARRYSLYTAVMGYATSQTLEITQVANSSFNPNNQVTQYHSAGSVDPCANIVTSSEAECDIETEDISTILASVVSWGTGKLFDETSYLYYAQRDEAGTINTGATGYSIDIPRSFMYLDEISVDGVDQLATASLKLCVLDDDTNPPWTMTPTVDLSGITAPTCNSFYFNGGVYENSTEIEGVLGQTWNPGHTVNKVHRTASATAHTVTINERNPEFRFRLAEMSETDIQDMQGRVVDTSMAFYLQKADTTYATSNSRVAKGTSEHIKASFTAGHVTYESVRGDGNDDVMIEFIVRPTGTITFSTAQAIS